MRPKPTSVRLSPELRDRLRAISGYRDRSCNWLMRRWIERGVAEAERQIAAEKSVRENAYAYANDAYAGDAAYAAPDDAANPNPTRDARVAGAL